MLSLARVEAMAARLGPPPYGSTVAKKEAVKEEGPCRHPNGWLEDLDPFDALGNRRFWCRGCGALSERGGRRWKEPRSVEETRAKKEKNR